MGLGGQSHLPQQQSPGQQLLEIFFLPNLYMWALEPGGTRSRFPRLRTPFSRWVTKPNPLTQTLPSPLFPAPDKELGRCRSPRGRSRAEPLAYFCRRVTQPFGGFGCCTTPGHREEEAEATFPYSSLSVFRCTLFGVGFFFNVCSSFTSYLMQANSQRGNFGFSVSVTRRSERRLSPHVAVYREFCPFFFSPANPDPPHTPERCKPSDRNRCTTSGAASRSDISLDAPSAAGDTRSPSQRDFFFFFSQESLISGCLEPKRRPGQTKGGCFPPASGEQQHSHFSSA